MIDHLSAKLWIVFVDRPYNPYRIPLQSKYNACIRNLDLLINGQTVQCLTEHALFGLERRLTKVV